MENILHLIVIFIAISVTQAVIVFMYRRKPSSQIVLWANLGLLIVGILFSLVGYLVALGEPGSWAGVGFLILIMTSLITVGISLLISMFTLLLLKRHKKTT
jgi:uncharacterized membrane protein